MRWIINYIRSCFCEHEWELIFDGFVEGDWKSFHSKVYRCKNADTAKSIKAFKTFFMVIFMKLKWKYFIDAYDLIRFIKENNIKREDIQQICLKTNDSYELFYWEI